MKIRATFTGENGLLGYLTGNVYELIIQLPRNYSDTFTTMIFGHDEFGNETAPCYYNTVIAFLRNWNHIEVME